MDQQKNDQSQEVQFTSNDSGKTPRRSFHMKKSTLIGALALLIIVAAIPLTVKFSQQRQNIRQQAAVTIPPGGTACPSRCSNNYGCTSTGPYYTMTNNCDNPAAGSVVYSKDTACPAVDIAALTARGIVDVSNANCSEGANVDFSCTRNSWTGIPDYIGGSNSLGNGYYCGPENPENAQRCGGIQEGKWLAGPIIPPGGALGHGGNFPHWGNPYGGRTPVAYDGSKDKFRFDFSSHTNAESSYSRVLRWSDDVLGAHPDLSPEIVIKHQLARLKRDHMVNNRWTGKEDQYGWDLQAIDHTIYVDGNAGIEKMRQETQSCQGTPQPTSTTPISCAEKLLVPPADFKTDFPTYTRNICMVENTETREGRNELTVCGDYWVSAYCNSTDDAHKNNAMFACRGWSQISNRTNADGTAIIDNDRLLLYYSNRIRTVSGTDKISANTTYEQRKAIWNSLMREVKQKSIAFPYEHSNANKPAEEVRNNALNAASMAIFGKSWGVISNQERLNNCPTTWDVPNTPTNPPPSTGPSTGPSTPSTGPSAGPVNPNGTNLNFTVVLHGIGAGGTNDNLTGATGNQDPKRKTRNAKLIISDETDAEATRKEIPTTITWDPASKKFKGTADASEINLATGSYTIKIKTDQFLTKRFGASSIRVTSGQTTNLPEAQLVSGNTNNDSELSILDYNILRGCISVLFPARDCNPEKKLAADLTDDDKVNTVDYELFVRELSVQKGD